MNAQSHIDLKPNRNIPDFRSGDTVRVHARVIEGDRERIQVFEGVVIRIRRRGPASSFTVRRIAHGIGVERIFPYHSPLVEKVEVTRVGKVRRAKLYYLRGRIGKSARIRAGERARFEALTAALPPEEPEVDEEEIIAADLEEAAAAEGEEGAEVPTEEGAEAAEGEEPTTEDLEGDAEGASEAEATTEEPSAEAEDPAAEAEEPAEEPPAGEPEAVAEEEPTAEAQAKEESAAKVEAEEEPASDEEPASNDAEEAPAEDDSKE